MKILHTLGKGGKKRQEFSLQLVNGRVRVKVFFSGLQSAPLAGGNTARKTLLNILGHQNKGNIRI